MMCKRHASGKQTRAMGRRHLIHFGPFHFKCLKPVSPTYEYLLINDTHGPCTNRVWILSTWKRDIVKGWEKECCFRSSPLHSLHPQDGKLPSLPLPSLTELGEQRVKTSALPSHMFYLAWVIFCFTCQHVTSRMFLLSKEVTSPDTRLLSPLTLFFNLSSPHTTALKQSFPNLFLSFAELALILQVFELSMVYRLQGLRVTGKEEEHVQNGGNSLTSQVSMSVEAKAWSNEDGIVQKPGWVSRCCDLCPFCSGTGIQNRELSKNSGFVVKCLLTYLERGTERGCTCKKGREEREGENPK